LLDRVFVVHELEDGRVDTFGDLTLTTRSVVHSVPTFGFRGEYKGRIVAYSGDTGPCESLLELSQHAHLLLCEAGASEQPPGGQAFHCTPEQAGQVAADAGVEHLVLTHLACAMQPDVALARASAVHRGQVSLAQVGTRLLA
jgi:ribonuclease BN (tRNA processing enzyme)